MKKYQLYILSLASGLLLSAGLFPNGIFPFMFLGFVPLLIAEDHIFNNPRYKARFLFLLSYITFFVWNILTTWWVKNASFGGAALAILCNALLMACTFMLAHSVKKRMGAKWGPVLFISFWIAFEFLHHRWEVSWPWLTLGNAFAGVPSLIQWYEYTGVFGGSLWVLLSNVLIFYFVTGYRAASQRQKVKAVLLITALLLVPVLISSLILSALSNTRGGVSVVVVQPDIDPYNEKFTGSYEEQVSKMLALAEQKVTDQTDYLVFPETALTEGSIWEDEFSRSTSIQVLQQFLKKYPRLKIVTGASTGKIYHRGEILSETARKFTQEDGYYDAYNTALQLDNTGLIQVYHKSKLVPGVESLPFPFIFRHFEGLAIDLGGTTGGLGVQKDRAVFRSPDSTMRVAPVICYESIYGEYVGEYVRNGANFIMIITNDGWWGDTPGYKQHLKFGALRAIETRRWIARSANTGISCFIEPSGKIDQATQWWTPAVISQRIALSNEETFYTKYGDYIGRAAMCIALAALIYSLAIRFRIIKKS